MNLNTRLSGVAPDLVEFGSRLTPSERKTIALRAAEWACRKSGMTSLVGEDRLTLFLDAIRTATPQERQQLADEVDDLDKKYFVIVERNDGLDEAGEALQWFVKARATASLLYALDSDELLNFCETLYEAQAAIDDLEQLRFLCRR